MKLLSGILFVLFLLAIPVEARAQCSVRGAVRGLVNRAPLRRAVGALVTRDGPVRRVLRRIRDVRVSVTSGYVRADVAPSLPPWWPAPPSP